MADFPITITPEAAKNLARMVQRKGTQGQFIRIGVKGGGCSGYEYLIRLEDRSLAGDLGIEIEGIRVVVDEKSAVLLGGSTLNWTGNLLAGGFAFDNPNAAKTCGCGTSFTLKGA